MDTSTLTDPLLLAVLRTAQATRAHILNLLSYLHDTHSNDTASIQKARHLQRDLNTHLSLLRSRQRSAVYSVRQNKTLSASARSEIDTLHLGLQNLFYEVRHLEGEIRGCEEYPHKYTQLSLPAYDEFLARHPDGGDGSEKEVMIARIKDEGEERRRLEGERTGLVKRKAELVRANAKQKEELEKLDREIEAWIEGGREKAANMLGERLKAMDAVKGNESEKVEGEAEMGGVVAA